MVRRVALGVGVCLFGLWALGGTSLSVPRVELKISALPAEAYGTVCGEGKTCDDAYEAAIKNCKKKKGIEWKILGPCSDTKDGKKRQCVSCKMARGESGRTSAPCPVQVASRANAKTMRCGVSKDACEGGCCPFATRHTCSSRRWAGDCPDSCWELCHK